MTPKMQKGGAKGKSKAAAKAKAKAKGKTKPASKGAAKVVPTPGAQDVFNWAGDEPAIPQSPQDGLAGSQDGPAPAELAEPAIPQSSQDGPALAPPQAGSDSRGLRNVITPGVDESGKPLPPNSSNAYTPKQKYVLDKLLESSTTMKQEWDGLTSRDDKRKFVQALIPERVSYSEKVDPKAAEGWLRRVVTRRNAKSVECSWVATTLTELEVLWGCDGVARGLKRGDCRVRPDGLYERRQGLTVSRVEQSDETAATAEAQIPADSAEAIQNSLRVELNSSEHQPADGIDDGRTITLGHMGGRPQVGRCSTVHNEKAPVADPMTDESMARVQSAYDMGSHALRTAKFVGKQLRQANT